MFAGRYGNKHVFWPESATGTNTTNVSLIPGGDPGGCDPHCPNGSADTDLGSDWIAEEGLPRDSRAINRCFAILINIFNLIVSHNLISNIIQS